MWGSGNATCWVWRSLRYKECRDIFQKWLLVHGGPERELAPDTFNGWSRDASSLSVITDKLSAWSCAWNVESWRCQVDWTETLLKDDRHRHLNHAGSRIWGWSPKREPSFITVNRYSEFLLHSYISSWVLKTSEQCLHFPVLCRCIHYSKVFA